ncbi:MAG: hypothetical protein HYY13_09240 [Nitrospirae bacterium]|nr:hypothetical protein [Nitrospirota bacterium]
MAVKKDTCFCLEVEDKPGTLAQFCRSLKKSNVNLKGVWGFGVGGGKARIFAVPQRAEKFQKAAAAEGWNATKCDVFYVSGKDQVGALVKTLEAAEQGGVNIHAVDAIAVGGKFGSYIWAESGKESDLGKVLGAK